VKNPGAENPFNFTEPNIYFPSSLKKEPKSNTSLKCTPKELKIKYK
jgi:hypothetical protein